MINGSNHTRNTDPEQFERAFLKAESELGPAFKRNHFPSGLGGDGGVAALHPRAATAEPAPREPGGAQSRTLLQTAYSSCVAAIKGGCGSLCLRNLHLHSPTGSVRKM